MQIGENLFNYRALNMKRPLNNGYITKISLNLILINEVVYKQDLTVVLLFINLRK
jgi:hypothetical protein